MKIAVIGSRETKSETISFMCGTVRRLAIDHPEITWVSGGCTDGPDKIVTHLALTYGIKHKIYLPNERRLTQLKREGNINLCVAADYTTAKYRDVITELHPYPQHLKDFTFELHGRNLNIIAGENLNNNVHAVFYAGLVNADGTIKGGTGMGIAYAKSLNIPCFNGNSMDEVIEFLTMLK